MGKSINEYRVAVQHAFEQALAIADDGTRRSFHEVEGGLRSALLELGRQLVLLSLARVVARPRAAIYRRGVYWSTGSWDAEKPVHMRMCAHVRSVNGAPLVGSPTRAVAPTRIQKAGAAGAWEA